MKAYPNFNAWKRAQSKSNQALIQKLRKLVNDCKQPLTETVKWGNGCWVNSDLDDLPVIYLFAMTKGVQFGFFGGSAVNDPKKLLQGKGQYVRHVPVKTKTDIDVKYFTKLVRNAVKIQY